MFDQEKDIDEILVKVKAELFEATRNHGAFNSAHEGYAVMLEEMDELWEQVKNKKEFRDTLNIEEECIQIAAMAVRMIHDIC